MDQKVPSCMLNEGGTFTMGDKYVKFSPAQLLILFIFRDNNLKLFSIDEILKLDHISGVIYSSPEVRQQRFGGGPILIICKVDLPQIGCPTFLN